MPYFVKIKSGNGHESAKTLSRLSRESRPADPVRREVFRQLASHPAAASTSGWVPPKALLSSTPLPLQKGTEECSSKPVCPKAKGARRKLAF